MKNILSLIVIAMAGFKLVQSFMNPDSTNAFLGMEMNVWLYRLIWVAAAALSAYSILRARKRMEK